MFRSTPQEQAHKLVQVLEDMGAKHAAYGVQDEHYDLVGACLLWTLEQGLGDEFTDEVCEAWVAAYGLLSGAMKRGAMSAAMAAAR